MKNIVLACALAAILITAFLLFHPEPAIMVIGSLIAFGKIFISIAVFHEYLSRTRFVFIMVTSILVLLLVVATLNFILSMQIQLGVDYMTVETVSNVKAMAWIIFFSVIALVVHFFYVWFFVEPAPKDVFPDMVHTEQ